MDDDFEMDDETYPIEGLRIKLHAINVTDVTIINDPPSVDVGGMVYVNATVQNYGSDPVFLNVTLYATAGVNTYAVNTTIFNYLEYLGLPPPPPPPGPGWVVRTELKAGETYTVTIFWDTTGFQEGNYTMSVKAFIVTPPTYIPPLEHRPDLEPDISDNEISDGEVRITPLSIPEHNLAVTTINVDPTDLEIPLKPTVPSEWASAEVTVKNIGNRKDRFNLTLTAYHDSSVFDSKSWWNQTLNPGLTRTFQWQFLKGTDDTEEGNYNLTATVLIVNATTLEEIPDQNTTDNTISEIFEIRLIPFASFTYSPLSPVVDQEVTFSASASYAPGADGGTIETYQWAFGDGSVGSGSVATHAYNRSGIFTATLTVTDDIGLTKKLSQAFYVEEKHDIAITDVSFSPQTVSTGGAIDITVAIQNTGGFQETFNVTVYYDQQEITTQTDITLAADANTTLYFTWTTLGVAGGDYEIKASATDVDEEIHTEDNVLVGGTVTIEKLSSTITVSAFPTTLTIGETVTINGTLSPVRAGVEVAIWYILNGGTSTLLANVTTNANGVYTHPWTPSEVGSYELRSSWLGDDLTLPSESAPQNLVVQEASSDIFLYIVGALAAVGVALLVYSAWSRRPKIPQKKPSE